eukprot:1408-Heterococcus_DN1.PRE.1
MENNQPVELIKRLIAETDNGSVLSYTVTYGGSGYTVGNPPAVKVDSPPFLDDTATAKAVLKPTGRIFRVKLTAAGKGYAKAPEVTITPPRAVGGRAATAICTLKGDKLAGIVVTNPGQGYRLDDDVRVVIAGPALNVSSVNVTSANSVGEAAGEILAELMLNGASAEAVLDMTVASVEVVKPGSGYGVDLPITVLNCCYRACRQLTPCQPAYIQAYTYNLTIPLCTHTTTAVTVDPPPGKVEFANFGQTARVQPVMSAPPEGKLLRSWLPPQSLQQAVTELLPSNLVPKLDPCLGNTGVDATADQYCYHYWCANVIGSCHCACTTAADAATAVLDPNYCVYYDNSEFQVYPSKSLAPYFSFLDGPRARYPVEKEKPLDLNVFLRFAACGAACGTAAHAVLIPIDVVKTRMQSEPKRYPSMGATFKTVLAEEGKDAFLLGAGATITGYF